jgi:hypothetical protein
MYKLLHNTQTSIGTPSPIANTCQLHGNLWPSLIALPLHVRCTGSRARSPAFARDSSSTATREGREGSSSAHHGHNQDHQDHVRDDLSTSTSLRHRHMVRHLAALHKHCALRAPDLYLRSPVRLGQTYETVRPLIRAEAMFQAPQTVAAARTLATQLVQPPRTFAFCFFLPFGCCLLTVASLPSAPARSAGHYSGPHRMSISRR